MLRVDLHGEAVTILQLSAAGTKGRLQLRDDREQLVMVRGLATATICFSTLWHCHVTPGTFKPLGEADHRSGDWGVGISPLRPIKCKT